MLNLTICFLVIIISSTAALSVWLSLTHIHKQCSTRYDCPLIKLAFCVVNGNDGRKWPFIRSLASLHSVALSFLLCVYVFRYSHSGLLYYTEPWRCFSGQRRRPKMPCCCCYHDNLGEKKKRTKPNLVQNASLVFLTCPANLIISSMKAAPATSQRCYFFCLLEKVLYECTGESTTGQQIIWDLVFRQTGWLYLHKSVRRIYCPRNSIWRGILAQ